MRLVSKVSASTPDEAEELLFKALEAQRTGDAHQTEFRDPVVDQAARLLRARYVDVYDQMLQEIKDVIDQHRSDR